MQDYSEYSTIVFIDSMVGLEGKPLGEQPWNEIDAIGPILILVVPQVNTEIDKRKRDGRLQKQARQFNRLIAPAAEAAAPVRIITGTPAVDIGIAICNRIDWNALDDLDPTDPDARVVAQILNARDVEPCRKRFLSQDTNPITMAARHGLKVTRLKDHWLRKPEPNPHDKELAKLTSRVRELEATEPEFQIKLRFNPPPELKLLRIRPLSDETRSKFISHILSKNACYHQSHSVLTPFDYDPTYDERYARYKANVIPSHAEEIHRKLEIMCSQIPFSLSIKNIGSVQAEHIVATITAVSGIINDRFMFYTLDGPRAPKMKTGHLLGINRSFKIPRTQPLIGRHEMHFAVEPSRSPMIEVHCADFRQGREWTFDGIVAIDPHGASSFKIIIKLSAANMRGSITEICDLDYEVEDANVEDVVDIFQYEWRTNLPMATDMKRALDQKDYEWFDFPDHDDE